MTSGPTAPGPARARALWSIALSSGKAPAKRIRELLAELEDLSAGIADSDPRSNRRHRKTPQNPVDDDR